MDFSFDDRDRDWYWTGYINWDINNLLRRLLDELDSLLDHGLGLNNDGLQLWELDMSLLDDILEEWNIGVGHRVSDLNWVNDDFL